MTSNFPLLVGSGRSGTTLLRNILDAHSEIAITHESHFVAQMARHRRRYEVDGGGFDTGAFVTDLFDNPNFRRQGLERRDVRRVLEEAHPSDFAAAVRAVFAAYAAAHGKSRYGDKTPGYVTHIELLADLFPEARFVHIIRDGRDVALAYLDRREWGPATLAEAAFYWRSRVGRGRAAGQALGSGRYSEVRYEDLVDDPESITREVCRFLALEYQPTMLRYHEGGREFISSTATPEAFAGMAQPVTRGMRDWRQQMAPGDIAFFEAVAGHLLADLGYERAAAAASFSLRTRVRSAEVAWQGKRVGARVAPTIRGLGREFAALRKSLR